MGRSCWGQLLLQDVERKSGDGDVADDGVSIRDGVSKDGCCRCMTRSCCHVAQAAAGGDSTGTRRTSIVVDTDSQLITAVDVLQRATPLLPDNLGALANCAEASEASTGSVRGLPDSTHG